MKSFLAFLIATSKCMVWKSCPTMNIDNGILTSCKGKRCLVKCDKGFVQTDRNYRDNITILI